MDRIEGAELQVGYCNDCGQARQFQTSGGVEQSQLDEWATEECTCAAANERRFMKRRKERAEANIDKLFGEKFPENGAVGCQYHHDMLDNGNGGHREEMLELFEEYLASVCDDWDKSKLVYDKWAVFKNL